LGLTVYKGKLEFPFQFELPQDIPCSFKSSYGKIEYIITAKFKRSGILHSDLCCEVPVRVLGILDLNNFPSAAAEVKRRGHTVLGGGPTGSTPTLPVDLELKTTKGGFIAGEKVPVTVQVNNKSSLFIPESSLVLQQITTFYAYKTGSGSSSKLDQFEDTVDILTKAGPNNIPPGSKLTWDCSSLILPQAPELPVSLMGCSLITREYRLKVFEF